MGSEMLDLLLEHALVFDGTGRQAVRADVGISENYIVFVGDGSEHSARKRLDLSGLAAAPGFIDGHTHGEGYVLNPDEEFVGKLRQGVTTEILGNCGISVFPTKFDYKEELKDYFGPFAGPYELSWEWTNYGSLRNKFISHPLVTNAGSLIGHGSLRIATMGFADRKPTAAELDKMVELLKQALEEGAVGLSLGLMYPPGLYAELDELVVLAKVAADYGRPVTSHIRNESFHLVDSVKEMIQVAERSGAKVVVSHHKAVGKANWGKLQRTLSMIDHAHARGLEIYCDVYPYTAGNTVLRSLLPPWALEGGIDQMLKRLHDQAQRAEIRHWMAQREDWENLSLACGWDSIVVSACQTQHELEGFSIAELASRSQVDPYDFVFDLLLKEQGSVLILLFAASEDDLRAAMSRSYCMIGSDGIPATNYPHPRLYGTFPRFLGQYVIDTGILPLEEGIRRITSLPARVYGMQNRGRIQAGYVADLVVFDPETIIDNADYDQPRLLPAGIPYVILDGEVVVHDERFVGLRKGQFIIVQD